MAGTNVFTTFNMTETNVFTTYNITDKYLHYV